MVARILPALDEANRHFWTCGANGVLHLLHCESCDNWIHPPAPRCRRCLSDRVAPLPVSGDGTVYSFSVNHHRWAPDHNGDLYVVAIVELPEQPGLRLTTNIVGVAPDQVQIGMSVVVDFEHEHEDGDDADLWIPVFRPAS